MSLDFDLASIQVAKSSFNVSQGFKHSLSFSSTPVKFFREVRVGRIQELHVIPFVQVQDELTDVLEAHLRPSFEKGSALQDWWGEIRGNAAGLEKTDSCAAPDQHAIAYRARCSVTNVRIPSLIYGNTAATFRAPSGGKIAGEKTVDRTLRQHYGNIWG